MGTELTKLIDDMQRTLEGEGYELYSRTLKERFIVLVM